MSLGPAASGYKPAGARRSSGPRWRFRLFPILVLAGFVAWFYWMTRDTFDPRVFIPNDAALTVTVADPVGVKGILANTNLWSAIEPFYSDAAGIQEQLAEPIPLPPWTVRHLVNRKVYAYANDSASPQSIVALSKMTWIGTVLERTASQFATQVTQDEAGGLDLRHVPEANLYYAVRGRVLILSQDRGALIKALTQTTDNTIAEAQYDADIAGANESGVYLRLNQDEAFPWFKSFDAAIRVSQDAVAIASRAIPSPEWSQQLDPIMNSMTRGDLQTMEAAPLSIALHSTRPMVETVGAIHALIAEPGAPNPWNTWIRPDNSADPWTFPQFLAHAVRNCQGPTALWLDGADPNEVMPVPFAHLWSQGRVPWDDFQGSDAAEGWPIVDLDGGIATLPMPGGESFQPKVHEKNGGVLVSNADDAESLATYKLPGNLLIQARPADLVDMIQDIGQPWADVGLIRDHSRASFDALMNEWRTKAQRIDSLSVHAAVEQPAIVIRTEIKLRSDLAPVAALR